jgi:hypothetical protein
VNPRQGAEEILDLCRIAIPRGQPVVGWHEGIAHAGEGTSQPLILSFAARVKAPTVKRQYG